MRNETSEQHMTCRCYVWTWIYIMHTLSAMYVNHVPSAWSDSLRYVYKVIRKLPWQQNMYTYSIYTHICCSVKWCHTQNSPLSVSTVPVTPQITWPPWCQRTKCLSWGRPTLGGPHYRTCGRMSGIGGGAIQQACDIQFHTSMST